MAICTKITSLIYAKGIENAFDMSGMFSMNNLPKDHRHPMVVCKGVGETVNRTLSKTVDFLAFVTAGVGVVIKAAGVNVIGVDQKGEIIF